MPKELTTDEHIEQLKARIDEASRKMADVDPIDGNLKIYLEAPDARTGYLITVEFIDEETMHNYHQDEAESAERAAGWPTP